MQKTTIALALLIFGCAAGNAQGAAGPVFDSDDPIRDFIRRSRLTRSALRHTRDPFTFALPKIERAPEPKEDRKPTRGSTNKKTKTDREPVDRPPSIPPPPLTEPFQILEKKRDDARRLLMQTYSRRRNGGRYKPTDWRVEIGIRAGRAVHEAEDALRYLETETFRFRAAGRNAVLLMEEDLLRILTAAQRLKSRSAVERRFAGLQLRIHGVIWTLTAPQVVVNGRLLQEGDSIHDARVLTIEPKTVTFMFEQTRFRVSFERP